MIENRGSNERRSQIPTRVWFEHSHANGFLPGILALYQTPIGPSYISDSLIFTQGFRHARDEVTHTERNLRRQFATPRANRI
jgi:hypothetical protein